MRNTFQRAGERLKEIDKRLRESPPHMFHPGWLLSRGMGADLPDGTLLEQRRNEVVDLIVRASSCSATDVRQWYPRAVARWAALTQDATRFARGVVCTAGRLRVGSSADNALETGIALHHTYGMPYLPGSVLKGCALAWARASGLETAYVDALFGREPDHEDVPIGEAGCVVFHDGWWIPTSASPKPALVREVVTSHHFDYYSGRSQEPTDCDDPIPVAQLAAAGAFYLVIEGERAWAEAALRVLRAALATLGLGARGAAGYGLFVTDESARDCKAAHTSLNELVGRYQRARSVAARATMTPHQRAEAYLRDLSPETLVRKLARDRAALQQKFGLTGAELREVALKVIHPDRLQDWKTVSRQKDKLIYKAYRFLTQSGEEDALDD